MLGFTARKRFGQHFLHEHAIIEKIVALINPKPTDHLLEIGPGMGALTRYLLPHVSQLNVVELDYDLIPLLRTHCDPQQKLIVHQADALTFDFRKVVPTNRRWRLVGNLPYNISTPLLFHLLEQVDVIADMHFMLQKEIVDRLVATPGDKQYGRLSIMLQYYCSAQKLFVVKPGAFQPAPKVDSAVVRLIPYQVLPWQANDTTLFADLVRTAFNHRRKILSNNLAKYISAEQLSTLGINPRHRPEQLLVKDYVSISNFITLSSVASPPSIDTLATQK